MNFNYTLYFALRMFQTNKLRTLLTILGISIGIGTILFLVSLGYGLQSVLLERIASKGALLSIDVKSQADVLQITDEHITVLGQVEGVEEVIPVLQAKGLLEANSVKAGVTVNMVGDHYFKYYPTKPAFGSYFNGNPVGDHEAIVSSAVLQLLGTTDGNTAIGTALGVVLLWEKASDDPNIPPVIVPQIIEQHYKVVGVINDPISTYVYIPAQTVSNIPIHTYAEAKIKTKDAKSRELARNKAIDMGFRVSAIADTLASTTRIFRIIQTVLGIFGFVALVVSAIGMFNTMTIALLERTKEIGIMKSLGARHKDVTSLFLIESSLLGLSGGVGGIIIGYSLGEIFNFGLNILARMLHGSPLHIFERPLWFVVSIFLFAVVVGFVTGVYPAIRAGRLNALDALRYK